MKVSIKIAFVALFCFTGLHSVGQQNIRISGTRFTFPLVERWIVEYNKSGSNLSADLIPKAQPNEKLTVRVVGHVLEKTELKPSEEVIVVSRFALLPVSNEKNSLAQKSLKKGLKPEELKKVFFEDPEESLEENTNNGKYQVYTRNARVCSSIAFARYFNDEPENIFGKGITGDDYHLIEAVKRDSLGITYNNLGYIYDLESRTLQKGLAVLPIDFNKNGKLEKEEQIYQNLDLLISFLEKGNKKQYLPTENIFFVIDKSQASDELNKFIRWVQTDGQSFAHEYGFLSLTTNDNKSAFNTNLNK
ncbi:hypothetical protein [Emticicia sp. BO119]|uniref:hypothetical protein n=1 Tax=Emticicia sp. BO119 TaxID=2757768 RepID=UPI0015F0658C|nr:hypothetical protein [Emticicia sp. BO119]MBA4850568.1 hypothetical protein [Emticicia sp. BO119]